MEILGMENEQLGNCDKQKNLHKASRCPYNQKRLKDFCLVASELHRAQIGCRPCPVSQGNEITFLQNRNPKESPWNTEAKALICLSTYVSLKDQGTILKTIFNAEVCEYNTCSVQHCQVSRLTDPLPLPLSFEHSYLQPVPAWNDLLNYFPYWAMTK